MRPLRSLMIAAVLGAALGAGGLVAPAEPPKGGFAPDPPARASRKQWSFEIVARDGKVSVERATATTLDKPLETPRVIGRFALELYIGRELLDRVRFDVPLMGGERPHGNKNRPNRPRFDEHVTTKVTARMADNPRATYLLMVDRSTGDTQKLAWPPESSGQLLPWRSGFSDAGVGELDEGGVRAVGMRRRDGGDAGAADAGRDGGRPP